MALEIQRMHAASETLYAVIRSGAQVWNGTQFSAWADSQIGSYDVPLASQGGDLFGVDFPAAINQGIYRVAIYLQSGGLPVIADAILDDFTIHWQGAPAVDIQSTTTLAGFSKLDAVNEMLIGAGESPVAGLDTGGSSDVALAEVVLDRWNLRVQAWGWHQNTVKDVKLAVDSNKNIPLSNSILEVDASDRSVDVVRRGKFLFDRKNNTFDFDSSVTVNQTVLLSYEDLSPLLKAFISSYAKRKFQQETQGGGQQDLFKQEEFLRAMADAKKEDVISADANWITDNTSIAWRGNRQRPIRS